MHQNQSQRIPLSRAVRLMEPHSGWRSPPSTSMNHQPRSTVPSCKHRWWITSAQPSIHQHRATNPARTKTTSQTSANPFDTLTASAVLQPRQLQPLILHTRKTRWKQGKQKHGHSVSTKGGTSSSPSIPGLQVPRCHRQTLPGINVEDNPTLPQPGRLEGSCWLEPVVPPDVPTQGWHGIPKHCPRDTGRSASTFQHHLLDVWRHQRSTQYCYCAKWELYSLL